jgi:uncharacterized protein YndB with AHSA1/START domain
MKRNLKLEAFYPYPPKRIWQAVLSEVLDEASIEPDPGYESDGPHAPPVDREALKQWLTEEPMDRMDREALKQWLTEEMKRGHTEKEGGNGDVVVVDVVDVDPPRLISLTGRILPSLEPTTLTATLDAERGGTRLTLRLTGFEGLRAIAFSYFIAWLWRRVLRKEFAAFLRKTLEPEA